MPVARSTKKFLLAGSLLTGLVGALLWALLVPGVEAPPPAPAATDLERGGVQRSPKPSASGVDTAQMPTTEQARRRATQLQENVRASDAQWPTEAFSEQATALFKALSKEFVHHASVPDDLCSDAFQTDALLPAPLAVIRREPLTIERWTSAGDARAIAGGSLRAELMSLSQGFAPTHLACKIVRVASTPEGFTTAVYAEGGAKGDKERLQWTAIWNCHWNTETQLTKIQLQDFEQVRTQHAQPWFQDAGPAVLGHEESYQQQLLHGMDHWVNRLEHRFFVNRLGHHGLALGDVNGDGLEDLYVCQPGGLPNRLYLHQPDGTAREVARASGVDILDDTTAGLLVDLDNDGDQDLVVLTVSGAYLLSNDGQGRFERQGELAGASNAFSLTAADYNQDGLLDLYVGRYWADASVRGAIPLPVPFYDARNGGANILWRNEGNGRFTDATRETGLDRDNTRYTMAAAWEDYDNDGDQDLYVANDFGRNCLYRNDNGQFTNVAASLGVEDTAAGMSVAWADYDHDGRQDLYVGNMFSSAGGRITYQRQYADRFSADAQQKLQRLARGNSLFRNREAAFDDMSIAAHVTLGRWAWGSVFIDVNNDSWDDLVVANGNVTTQDTGDL